MKKAAIFISSILLLGLAVKANAITSSVNVKTTGDSSSHVEVKNNVNSSNTTTTTTNNSHSSVTVTTNGETKRFESNGEAINYESPDGSTKVKIDGNSNSNSPTPTKISSNSADKTDELKKKVEEAQKETDEARSQALENQKSLFRQIQDFIKNLFSSIF